MDAVVGPHPDWPQIQRAVERISAARGAGRLSRLVYKLRPATLSLPPAIYILAFHSVIDPKNLQPWEKAYDKVSVTAKNLENQLDFLSGHTTPLSLSEAMALVDGEIDRPYLVLTFDDGYMNTLTNAAPIIRQFGLRPTLFVNGAFAGGGVYYRALVAMLTRNGHAAVLAEELGRRIKSVPWSSDATTLFNQTKDQYTAPGRIEEVTDIVFRRVFGDPAALRVHLQPDDVVELVRLGWEVGNHTYRHDVLSLLSREQVSESIEANEAYWEGLGIRLLPCVAFPNGAAKHVGDGIKSYLDENLGFHGMFCNGGVNLTPSRTEWLRIPVSNMNTRDFVARLATEVRVSESLCI